MGLKIIKEGDKREYKQEELSNCSKLATCHSRLIKPVFNRFGLSVKRQDFSKIPAGAFESSHSETSMLIIYVLQATGLYF
jgi:hypothetical protein